MTEFFVTLAAGFVGYLLARRFVSRRLRFVDAVQSRFAPLVAALTATLVTWPLTLLPANNLNYCNSFRHRHRPRYGQWRPPGPAGGRGAEADSPHDPY